MTLDLTSLQKSLTSLQSALRVLKNLPQTHPLNEEEIKVLKAGVIQNFEFTYELCLKFAKRWLENNASHLLSTNVSRKQLFRYACEYGLIRDFETWLKYHELRNLRKIFCMMHKHFLQF